MNTLENEVDVLLQEYAKELIAQDAAVLDSTEEIPVPEKLRLRAVKAMKKAKKEAKPTSPFFRFARIAVASLVAAVCLATASIVYATYTRPEIWGIDIVDNGDHYVVSIVSTYSSPSTIEVLRHIPETLLNTTEVERFSGKTKHIYDYYVNDVCIFSLTQSISDKRTKNVDDDCIIKEIWIKDNKAVYIEYPASRTTSVFWFDGEYCYTLDSFEGLPSEELVEIANSIK